MQPQIILLKEGTDTSQGKAQLVSNINACMVRSGFGVLDGLGCGLGWVGLEAGGGGRNYRMDWLGSTPLIHPSNATAGGGRLGAVDAGAARHGQAHVRRQGRHHLQRWCVRACVRLGGWWVGWCDSWDKTD